ncbi:MAG: phosphatase PAP2 family protein [Ginsengibacter sp.]
MTIKTLFKENTVFFAGYLLLLFFALFILFANSKAAGFVLLNPYHTRFLDFAFQGITLLGDGLFSIAFCVVLLLIRKKYVSLLVFISYASSGIAAQVLKYFISEPRPAIFLEHSNYHYFIENVTLHNYHSFPSGHSATIFALISIVAFASKNKLSAIPLLIIGALVGYSRMYLGQHFMVDVTIGSLTGILFAIISWILLYPFYQKRNKKAGESSPAVE